ncbi:hypothetical protein CRG98_034679 [Punica granatum]|uniref:Uncharacterized protein n=1 Tax=Punica granatum TaxID=22663 RepID=A0A2I0ILR0_PUNGR|nr:hypothetical protein CRG98_034679 [Punica granatum]
MVAEAEVARSSSFPVLEVQSFSPPRASAHFREVRELPTVTSHLPAPSIESLHVSSSVESFAAHHVLKMQLGSLTAIRRWSSLTY